MNRITIDAPCKINLSLDIVRRMENGYHEVDMVMQTVSLYDTITLSLGSSRDSNSDIRLRCILEQSDAVLACDESNIAVRCARAFLKETGTFLAGNTLDIELVKRIPMMAGLGGGSADGAAVLVGLNRLLNTQLSLQELEQIGLCCGADIPFCLRGGTQRAQGIGEQFSPLPAIPDCPIVIIKPRFGISTKNAFQQCDTRPYLHADVNKMVMALADGQIHTVADALQNVFESLCSPEESQLLIQARELLDQCGALGTLLSGSGSALFGLFEEEITAQRCAENLADHPLLEGVFLCRPVAHGAYCSVPEAKKCF